MLALIDNYDSFTYNLVQYLGELGADIRVFRNDQISLNELIALKPDHLVISPGPGEPIKDGGVSPEAIKHFTGKIPVLGVCLGHQCLGAVYGGKVDRAPRLMHGKTSPVTHNGQGVFKDIPSPFEAMRYHSLVVYEPIREKRAYYLAHPTIPRDVLANGIRRMQTEAKETMKLVRDVTGLSYSLDLFADEVDIFGNEE